MSFQEMKKRLESEPDFVASKRFDYSLDKLMKRYPDGAPTKIIAQAMLMSEDEVEELYESVVFKMRTFLTSSPD